jgi:three-Cys-motif partner protein
MARDLHEKPFQEHTLNKLQLFFDHARAWLSVLVRAHDPKKRMPKKLGIYDFFCGPGRDEHGQDGSPLLIMRALSQFRDDIKQRRLDVSVLFNDVDAEKVEQLRQTLEKEGYVSGPWKIDFQKKSFEKSFAETYPSMRGRGNLILLDQHGIRFFTPELFKRLRSLSWTDTLIFMSSSYAYRFRETPEIQQYLDAENIFLANIDYYYVHRAITQYFRNLIPADSEYYLIPYSFKSGGNIYGLIFACGNALGAQKFLEAA